MDILSSASALQRFKSRNGLTVSTGGAASTYIAICKIKRSLQSEFDKDMIDKYHELDKDAVIAKLTERLGRLPASTVRVVNHILQTKGVEAMAKALVKPKQILMRL